MNQKSNPDTSAEHVWVLSFFFNETDNVLTIIKRHLVFHIAHVILHTLSWCDDVTHCHTFSQNHRCSLPNMVIEKTFLVILLYAAYKYTPQWFNFTLRRKSVLQNNYDYCNKILNVGKDFQVLPQNFTIRFSGICLSKEDVTTFYFTYWKIWLLQTKDNKFMNMPFRIIKYSL